MSCLDGLPVLQNPSSTMIKAGSHKDPPRKAEKTIEVGCVFKLVTGSICDKSARNSIALCNWSLSDCHHFFLIVCFFFLTLVFYSVGASIQFSCDDSYVLQGSKSITCQRVTETLAAWSDHRPICRSECERSPEQTLSVKMLSDPVKSDVQCIQMGTVQSSVLAREACGIKGVYAPSLSYKTAKNCLGITLFMLHFICSS